MRVSDSDIESYVNSLGYGICWSAWTCGWEDGIRHVAIDGDPSSSFDLDRPGATRLALDVLHSVANEFRLWRRMRGGAFRKHVYLDVSVRFRGGVASVTTNPVG